MPTGRARLRANGNLIKDLNKGIAQGALEYNLLNLVRKITLNANTLEYYYDAGGQKHQMVYSNTTDVSKSENTRYVGSMEWLGNNLKRIGTGEGQYIYTATQTGLQGQYQYNLNDHLGNTRVVVTDSGKVLQHTDYYAFGLQIPILPSTSDSLRLANKYLFLDRELQPETGYFDLKLRQYDPAKARFDGVDSKPDDGDQESLSTYQYGWNNPILRSDPNGDCPNCVTGAIGAGIGALIGGAIEAGTQLYQNGEVNDWKAVGGAALQGGITGGAAGFTGGASLLATAAVAGGANAVGGAASRAMQGQKTTGNDVLVDVAVGAGLGAAGKMVGNVVKNEVDNLSSAAKGRLGEAATEIKYAAKGYVSDGKAIVRTGGSTPTGRVQVAKYDHNMRNVVTGNRLTVESKFNTAKLTPNQTAAQSRVTTQGGLIIDRTTSQGVGNGVKAATVGAGAGIDAQRNIKH